MGTRSLTVFQDEDGKEIVVMYRQFDGYPEGLGQGLAAFLKGIKLVNGLGRDSGREANGMGCLAAQVVAQFKDEPGNVYLYPAGTRDTGEEFIYTLYPGSDDTVWMKVQSGRVTYFGNPGTKQEQMQVLFEGSAADFTPEKCEAPHD